MKKLCAISCFALIAGMLAIPTMSTFAGSNNERGCKPDFGTNSVSRSWLINTADDSPLGSQN